MHGLQTAGAIHARTAGISERFSGDLENFHHKWNVLFR
jgi:hypothetical protein